MIGVSCKFLIQIRILINGCVFFILSSAVAEVVVKKNTSYF